MCSNHSEIKSQKFSWDHTYNKTILIDSRKSKDQFYPITPCLPLTKQHPRGLFHSSFIGDGHYKMVFVTRESIFLFVLVCEL